METGWLWWWVLVVAVVQVVAKVAVSVFFHFRAWAPLKEAGMPGLVGDAISGFGPEFEESLGHIHDHRMKLLGGSKLAFARPPIFSSVFMVFSTDARVVEHMLKTKFDVWTKAEPSVDVFYRMLEMWIGNGIFSAKHGVGATDKGRLWYTSRKTAAAIFTRHNFQQSMQRTFVEKANVLLGVLEQTPPGGRIDMQGKFFAFTMDSIMRIFFGRETNTLVGTADEYANAYDTAHKSLVVYYLKNVGRLVVASTLLPWPLGSLLPEGEGLVTHLHMRVDEHGRAFRNAVRTLSRISDEIVDAKRNEPGLREQTDLLALFMNSNDEEGVPYSHPKHRVLMRNVALNFIIAGRDTTACALSWLFFVLATNPEVQRRLCEEVDSRLGDNEPTLENTSPSRMPYLNGVVYETLRLYPPVPQDSKVCAVDDVLPGGARVRAGTELFFFPYGMGRDPDRYPDPLVVKPERWIPFKAPSHFEFPVFQAGPRICLGMNMALLEIKVLTCMLLQRFTFTLQAGELEKITYSIMITMSIRNSEDVCGQHQLWLHPHKRCRAAKG